MDEHPAVALATAKLPLLDAAGDVSLLGLSGAVPTAARPVAA